MLIILKCINIFSPVARVKLNICFRAAKALERVHKCIYSSKPLLFAYATNSSCIQAILIN